MTSEIFVTNKNEFLHTDRYNGVEFVFPAGEKTLVPVDAARLFFGFQAPDKTEALIRQGWGNDPEGPKKLARFIFTQGVMVEVPIEQAAAA